MGAGSRNKGSKAEIEVAKKFEVWWSTVEPGSRFVRTPLSGGWGGKDIRAGFRASGDLMTTAKQFPFTIEVKRREGWAWSTLLAGRKCPVWGWWNQAIGQAKEQGGIPLLIFRKNREDWSLMLPLSAACASPLLKFEYSKFWTGTWTPKELRAGGADFGGVLPCAVPLGVFLFTLAKDWLGVAATFPRT